MARITISWAEFPNNPEASEYSKIRAHIGAALGCWSLIVVFASCAAAIGGIGELFQYNAPEKILMCIWYWGLAAINIYIPYVAYSSFTERGIHLRLLKRSMMYVSKELNDKLVAAYKKDAMENFKAATIRFWVRVIAFIVVVMSVVAAIYFGGKGATTNQLSILWLVVALLFIVGGISALIIYELRLKANGGKEKHYVNVYKILATDEFLYEYKNPPQAKNEEYEKSIMQQGGWQCKKCGKVHPAYTGTCGCGGKKND